MADDTLEQDESIEQTTEPKASSGVRTKVFLGLLWLGIAVWSTNATITGSGTDLSGVLADAVAALPDLVAAVLLTSASIACAASSRFASAGRRLLTGLAVGLAFGAIAAAGIRFAYGSAAEITVLAVTVGVASLLGGAVAMLPSTLLEAGLWATSWVFFAILILGVMQPNWIKLLGGGPTATPEAQATADTRFFYAQAVATGLISAWFALRNMTFERLSVLGYVVAGSFGGLVLLAGELLTRFSGTTLVNLMESDPELSGFTSAERLRQGLIVLAVGGIVSLVSGIRAASRPE